MTTPRAPSCGPPRTTTSQSSERSSSRRSPDASRRPSGSYGTKNASSPSARNSSGTTGSYLASMGDTLSCSSFASSSITPSTGAKILRAASPSSAVCCSATITEPSARPSRARSAGAVTSRSAFIPQSELPRASTRSARCSHAKRSSKRSSRRFPLIFTTGFEGSNHAPWISLMTACGSPAFCGSPSWFCWIQRFRSPAPCTAASTRWVFVGLAIIGPRLFWRAGAGPTKPAPSSFVA
mmetsp:Transcript_31465/g.90287  ORF Transcript_31465/g.90287 Transcript_31465/m.90287 type:complete len:238 (+) Transcript_31465:412-1125(+)